MVVITLCGDARKPVCIYPQGTTRVASYFYLRTASTCRTDDARRLMGAYKLLSAPAVNDCLALRGRKSWDGHEGVAAGRKIAE